ncbi:MAG: hypothetical protein R3344_09540 [Acidobacteriota bacterium]|nr:hypothetical protein [Acidobacteriota bacterium]
MLSLLSWLPPAAVIVATVVFLGSDDPRRVSKAVVTVLCALGLFLQFGTTTLAGTTAGLVLNSAVAVFVLIYLRFQG